MNNKIKVIITAGGGIFGRLHEKLSEDEGIAAIQVRNNLLDVLFAAMDNKASAVFISADIPDGDSLAAKLEQLEPVPHIFAVMPYDSILRCCLTEGPHITILRHPVDPGKIAAMVYETLEGREISAQDYNKYLHNYVSELLSRLCITPNYNGFSYLREAIKMAVTEPVHSRSFSKIVYPRIADEFNTTTSGIERNIRTVITKGWEKASAADKTDVFGTCALRSQWKPTNGEFILIIADKIVRQMDRAPAAADRNMLCSTDI